MILAAGIIVAGLAVGYLGARWLAGKLLRSGLRAGWSVLTISLVLMPIALGLPILAAVALLSALDRGSVGLALCIGVAISSLLLGVGLLAFHAPIELRQGIFRQEWMFLAAAGGMLWLAGADGQYSRLDGQFLLTLCMIRLWLLSEQLKAEPVQTAAAWRAANKDTPTTLRGLTAAGLLALLGGLGLGWGLARAHGLLQPMSVASGDLVLTLSLGPVAIGLALGMLSFFFEAGSRASFDQAFGILVGTLSFCWLVVLPICLLLWPMPAPPAMWWLDQPAMLAATIALLPMVRVGGCIGRVEGFLLLVAGMIYLFWGMLSGLL